MLSSYHFLSGAVTKGHFKYFFKTPPPSLFFTLLKLLKAPVRFEKLTNMGKNWKKEKKIGEPEKGKSCVNRVFLVFVLHKIFLYVELVGGLTSNCYKFPTILHNADSHLNFYEVIKTEIRSLSFECQRKSQRVFAFEPVPSLKAPFQEVFRTLR